MEKKLTYKEWERIYKANKAKRVLKAKQKMFQTILGLVLFIAGILSMLFVDGTAFVFCLLGIFTIFTRENLVEYLWREE